MNNMSNNLLKSIIVSVDEHLEVIINCLLHDDISAEQLKIALLCQILKSFLKDQPQSYRPNIISTISAVNSIL